MPGRPLVPVALPAVEIRPLSGVYDYESRYTAGATRFVTPAELPDDVRQVAQPVLAHRFIVATDSAGVRRPDQVLRDLLGALPVPTSAR